MSVIEHWTATRMEAIGLRRDFIEARHIADYEAEGWTVEGPFVPAEQLQGAVDRAEKAEAELAKVESILVAADRVREAYDAMLDGRKLGPLPDFGGQ